MDGEVVIRPYRDEDERGWVVCRVLSFLDSAFFDDVRQTKEHYERPSIELVAERNGERLRLHSARRSSIRSARPLAWRIAS